MSPENIVKAIPSDVKLSDAEARAVVEIAAIAVGVDRAIHRDEITVLKQIAERLKRNVEVEFSSLFAKLGAGEDKDGIKRLGTVAAQLESAAAREIAYKAAYAVTLADLVSTTTESAFNKELLEVLKLSDGDASRLGDEVKAAMKAE